MTLFKTSVWTGISTAIKALMMYLMWKVIAVYTGPAGVAMMEQFQNFLQISRSALICGVNQAIVKYVAEYKKNEVEKTKILSTAVVVNILFCLFIVLILVSFSSELSVIVLQTATYKKIMFLVAGSTLLFAINIFGINILNGELEIKKYTLCTIVNTMLNFMVTIYLIIHYGIYGGLIGFVLNQSIVGFFVLAVVVKSPWFKLSSYIQGVRLEGLNKLVKYTSMTFVTTLVVPLSFMLIREYITHRLSWQDAGYWQGIMRLSVGYLIVMNLIFSAYYIPKLSGMASRSELKSEIWQSYKLVFPLVLVGIGCIFLLKKPITVVMYSSAFLPMLPLFKYQLIGDVARMGTWLLTNILLAKAMVKTFVSVEIFFSFSYVAITIIFVHYFGLMGAAIGFAVAYLLYWIFMIIFSMRYLNVTDPL